MRPSINFINTWGGEYKASKIVDMVALSARRERIEGHTIIEAFAVVCNVGVCFRLESWGLREARKERIRRKVNELLVGRELDRSNT